MASEALTELMRSYDIDGNGCLDKIEWVKLCSHDTINLSPELASALFDGLDTDADGSVRISDIMKELAAYEAGDPVATTPTRRSVSSGPNFQYSLPSTPKTPRKISHPMMPVVRESRGQNRRLWERRVKSGYVSQPRVGLDWSGDGFMTKTEVAENGDEVFSTTPVAVNPSFEVNFQSDYILNTRISRSVVEFGSPYSSTDFPNPPISRSYPELLPTFNNVMEDIRNEIKASREEKHTLEENYLKEKAARKQDLIRMENELEMQIQRYEERAKTEVQDKIKSEYDTMINAKEKEIEEIRSQVEVLKKRIKDSGEQIQTRTTPDSTTVDQINLSEDPVSPTPWPYVAKSPTNQDQLKTVMEQLARRESELSALKAQLEMQERQIEV
ncbi:unnamed protein product [Echinostoma caproni]|uniref:EF-hand domain-containing protein n=1 Tax=Echinostoma caproni TaxID=27848 RepID=A0A183A8F0_9TREM|nr:unnamed protein product [Echinostoma caproni]